MDRVDLQRYELTGLLGSGADYEVRSAVDRETGHQVVIKRPVPQMIARKMHGSVEERTERTIRLHEDLANEMPEVCPMLGYTDPANHDSYFGDALEQEYRVTVSERAKGIPLVGDARSRILRVPIGLGQNLFCLFPWCYIDAEDPFPVQRQILRAEEQFYQAGLVLLDLGPQNIFFQPGSGRISIIDPGALLTGDNDRTPVGRAPQDIHDFYLEMLKFYTSFQPPPTDATGYRDPYNQRPVVNFGQELDEMSRSLALDSRVSAEAKEVGTSLFGKVRDRQVQSFIEFKTDISGYLEALRQNNLAASNVPDARKAWLEALQLLREDHWKKYLFDAETELAQWNSA